MDKDPLREASAIRDCETRRRELGTSDFPNLVSNQKVKFQYQISCLLLLE